MNPTTIQQQAQEADALITLVASLYDSYFKTLEVMAQNIPDSDVEKQLEVASLIREVKEAMEADMAIFDKAIAADVEAIQKIPEQLQIQAIHQMLNNTK